ncbi:MAG: hypothetical protein IJP86_07460 [Synergistaceae bacterium]|nr:hypothetical protein [Synergistaceae bacterium]
MDTYTEPKQLTSDELWAFVEEWSKNPRPIDPAEVGLRRKSSPYGYETFCDGDFSIKLPGVLGKIARFLFE